MDNNTENGKRGWLLDQLMMIGHYEAELTHDDEQIQNIHHDLENNSGDLEAVEKLSDEMNFRENLMTLHYEGRAKAEEDIFTAFPELDIDKKKWCDIKHSCAIYTIACEIYHARDFDPVAKENMLIAGKALVLLVSKTFGFEPMDCMRCLNDSMTATDKKQDGRSLIKVGSEIIDVTEEKEAIDNLNKYTEVVEEDAFVNGEYVGKYPIRKMKENIDLSDTSDSIIKTPKIT